MTWVKVYLAGIIVTQRFLIHIWLLFVIVYICLLRRILRLADNGTAAATLLKTQLLRLRRILIPSLRMVPQTLLRLSQVFPFPPTPFVDVLLMLTTVLSV